MNQEKDMNTSSAAEGNGMVPKASKPDSSSRKETIRAKEGLLVQLIKNLNVRYWFERSVKIAEKKLFANRFTFTISNTELKDLSCEKIIDICTRMDMPQSLLESFKQILPGLSHVHFGFEERETSCVYKTYGEFKVDKKSLPASAPFLGAVGFKWDAFDKTRQVLSKYTFHPSLPIDGIFERVSNIFDSHRYSIPFESTKSIVQSALARTSFENLLYLEVADKNTQRRSFNINVRDAGLQPRDVSPVLTKMFQHHAIPSEVVKKLYERSIMTRICNISGGLGSNGKDFFTVYGVRQK